MIFNFCQSRSQVIQSLIPWRSQQNHFNSKLIQTTVFLVDRILWLKKNQRPLKCVMILTRGPENMPICAQREWEREREREKWNKCLWTKLQWHFKNYWQTLYSSFCLSSLLSYDHTIDLFKIFFKCFDWIIPNKYLCFLQSLMYVVFLNWMVWI